MAFDLKGWDSGPTKAKGTPKTGSYINAADSLATILGAGYFDSTIVAEQATVGDLIQISGSDGAKWIFVSAVTSSVDITTANLSA